MRVLIVTVETRKISSLVALGHLGAQSRLQQRRRAGRTESGLEFVEMGRAAAPGLAYARTE
jgi:hypothetical protein